ncbi:MAG TPA: hypothetical protein VHI52_07575, partial [Verrucomicrobiae bacterium]|nr:hypothetical protein [Verrucomicrobiae bacterium]
PKTGNVVTQVVSGGQQYDTRSNQLTQLSSQEMAEGMGFGSTARYVESTLPTTYASDRTIVTVSPVVGQ